MNPYSDFTHQKIKRQLQTLQTWLYNVDALLPEMLLLKLMLMFQLRVWVYKRQFQCHIVEISNNVQIIHHHHPTQHALRHQIYKLCLWICCCSTTITKLQLDKGGLNQLGEALMQFFSFLVCKIARRDVLLLLLHHKQPIYVHFVMSK